MIKEDASAEDVSFSSDETQITVLVQSKKSPIHVWPLNMVTMAKKLCSCIKQNMTLEEWEQYIGMNDVANGVPYQSTCTNLPLRKRK